MDITSPITLWKEYGALALPLNKSALSQKNENGVTVREFYFDGYTTVDGRTRAYIKIYESAQKKGSVLYLADKTGKVNAELLNKFLDFGYSVAVLDYLGKSERERYTMYPKSLSACNLDGVDKFSIVSDVNSNWYVWTCISRRAIKLLEELYEGAPVFALGVGLGGTTVYKLAAFNDGLSACATLLNILPNVEGEGNSLINYRASLDNAAYATISTVPMFMAVCSNDNDSSLDNMAELAKNTKSLKQFRIVERAFTAGIKSVYDNLINFFAGRAEGEPTEQRPDIEPSNSDKNLYFNISINDVAADRDLQVKLYVAFCIEQAPFRNWMNIPLISLGKDKYMAKINVCQENRPIYAFVNAIYDGKTVYSSDMISVVPKSIGVVARAGVGHRKIYDGSMREDCWLSRNGDPVTAVKGPYGIDGVSSNGSLITFKPGDPLFSVPPDTLLQIMVCGKPQTLNVSVAGKNEKYDCSVFIKNEGEWQTISLSHMNFKGKTGMLADWSSVLLLEFTSDSEFIIGSVIWV